MNVPDPFLSGLQILAAGTSEKSNTPSYKPLSGWATRVPDEIETDRKPLKPGSKPMRNAAWDYDKLDMLDSYKT